MKKVLFATTIFIMVLSVKTLSQRGNNDVRDNDKTSNEGEFKPFKVDISLGYAIPIGGTGAKSGVLFAVEPKYAIMPEISLGLRIEAAVTLSGVNLNSGTTNGNASVKAAGSYVATGDYYFSNNDFRPFLGAGLGIFVTAGVQEVSSNPNVASGSKFGGLIRGGFEYKHFRFGLEYNLVGKSVVPPSSTQNNDGYTLQNSYVGIKFGVCIGGGRKHA